MWTDNLGLIETEYKLEQCYAVEDDIVLWLWILKQFIYLYFDNYLSEWLFWYNAESIHAIANVDNGIHNKPIAISIITSLLVEQ